MKKLVNSAFENKIYYATVNDKTHTMSSQKDVTNEAIMCVFQWFMTEFENNRSELFEITYPDIPFKLTMTRKERTEHESD